MAIQAHISLEPLPAAQGKLRVTHVRQLPVLGSHEPLHVGIVPVAAQASHKHGGHEMVIGGVGIAVPRVLHQARGLAAEQRTAYAADAADLGA
jgi:hypothetical protein